MKKSVFYIIPLLAFGLFTSCEEEPFKGIAQENPQEEVVKAENLQTTYGSGIAGETLDLNTWVDKNVPVITVSELEGLPANSQVSFTMQLATKEDFSDARDIEVVDGCVSANEWSDDFRAMLGRSPKAKTNYVRFVGYVTDGDNIYRLGGKDTYYCAKSLTVTPIDLGIKIESAYYLIGTCNGWNPDAIEGWKFSHSDADVYDDPVFTIDVEVSADDAEGGWWWKIVPQSSVDNGDVWTGIFGVETDGDTSLSGYLTDQGNPGAGCIKDAGAYKLTINMEDGTYEFANNSCLYAVGDGSGWGFDDYTCQKLFAWGDGFAGYAYVQSMVKFTTAPDWSHGDYGMGDQPGTLAVAGGNIPVDAPGLYYADVNLGTMTYALTNIATIGMIGDFNSWGGDVELTPNENFLIWTGTLTLENAGNWKFRMNGGWDLNLGGTPDNLVPNGDNLYNEAGTYTVTLDLRTLPLTCTVK